MADDNVLRIGAEFDVAPLINSTKQAIASNDRLGASITELAARFKAQGLNSQETASALINLEFSEKEATEASLEHGAALDKEAVAENEVAGATRSASEANLQARIATDLLTGQVGRAEQAVVRFIARSSTIGPILQTAFPLFAAVAFLSIVDSMIEKLVSAADAMAGWGAAAKKAYEEAGSANLALLRAELQRQTELQKQNEIGLDGIGKQRTALTDAEADLQRYNAAAIQAQKAVIGIEKEIADLKSQRLEAAFDPTKFNYATLGKDIEEANRQLENQIKLRDELTGKVRDLKISVSGEQKGVGEQSLKDQEALSAAQIAREKSVGTARVAAQQEADRELLAAHAITLEEDRKRSLDAENAKYEDEVANIKKRRALVEQEGKTTGRDISPQLETLKGEGEAAEITHRTALGKIAADTDEQIKKRDQERATSAVENAQREIEASDRAGEAYARLVVAHADTKTEATAAGLALEQRITKTYEDQIAALKLKAEVLRQSDAVGNEKEINALNAEEIALDAEKEAAIRATRSETKDKLRQISQQETDDQVTAYNQQIGLSENAIRIEEEENRRAYSEKREGIKAYTHEAIALAEQEYQEKVAIYAKEIALIKAAVDAEVLTEEQGKKRLDAIWAEEAKAAQDVAAKEKKAHDDAKAAITKEINDVTAAVNRGVISWIQGQQTFAQAAREVWQKIEADAINAILKIGEKWLIEHVIMAAISKIFGLDDGTSAAATKKAAAAAVAVNADAAWATADVFLQAIEHIPFPANLAAAPALAALTHGEVLSISAFEQGGIVPSTGIHKLHENEMVLDNNLSTFIQNSVTNNTESGSRRTGDLHVHIAGGSNMTHDDIVAAVRKGARDGKFGRMTP